MTQLRPSTRQIQTSHRMRLKHILIFESHFLYRSNQMCSPPLPFFPFSCPSEPAQSPRDAVVAADSILEC